jgi:hypothetical protein
MEPACQELDHETSTWLDLELKLGNVEKTYLKIEIGSLGRKIDFIIKLINKLKFIVKY